MTTVAILGSGFGLYGYLPAIATTTTATIALPERYRDKFNGRKELVGFASRISWKSDEDAALREADTAVLALAPKAQEQRIEQCLALANIRTMLLEKPLAATPAAALALAAQLDEAGKIFRIGYLFRLMPWALQLKEALHSHEASRTVTITWHFMAHHYRQASHSWKQDASQGGGALNFYGIHLIALLAEAGYEQVTRSVIRQPSLGDVESWTATFEGTMLPPCHVVVDSRCERTQFVVMADAPYSAPRVDLADPFDEAATASGLDRRVSVLEAHCRSAFDGQQSCSWYGRALVLWMQAVVRSRTDAIAAT